MQADISIIIVNYNVKEFLYQCLLSIEEARKDFRLEIIVVDNNSSDNSQEFLSPLFPAVEFLRLDENIGFGRANNLAIQKAKGKYILILNPDTLLDRNTLEIMYNYMEAHPETGISGCKVLNIDGSFQHSCRRGFPTPWASFCKLSGLQRLFPKSKIFGKYNLTFRNIDESCQIDALMGAFMFARSIIFEKVAGFDPDFFMYGEDIDLCYRTKKAGWEIAYVPETSIIHYKGESTKRSNLNEVRIFYDAMLIFAKKHFSHSFVFLIILKLGILVRSVIAHINKYRKDLLILLADLAIVNSSLLCGTYIWKGIFFGFPGYAYPTVFIALSIVVIAVLFSIGEYFESKHSIRKSFLGLSVSFLILSSLTYFFKDYGFSRGVLLITTGFSIIGTSLIRIILNFYNKLSGVESDKRVAIIGINSQALKIAEALQNSDARIANFIGLISTGQEAENIYSMQPILGNVEYLDKIIEDKKLHEIIICDNSLSWSEFIKFTVRNSNPSLRFHIAGEYEEVLTSRIIDEITGKDNFLPDLNLGKLRYRLIKRIIDIAVSLILLSAGLPFILIYSRDSSLKIKSLLGVLLGKYSLIGIYPLGKNQTNICKPGLIGLAYIANPERLSMQTIEGLNGYYLRNFNLSLDIDIFIKYLTRKKGGS